LYREKKTIGAAAYLLSKLGNEMQYIKLIKLLYLADREFVKQKGRTISGDNHFSLPYGPILSKSLDAITEEKAEWTEIIGADLESKTVWLKQKNEIEELSKSEISVLDLIVENFGHMPGPQPVEYTHTLPEWKKPTGKKKSQEISLREIAEAVGHFSERVDAIVAGQSESKTVNRFLNQFRESA